jgi:hypothetical protein
MKYDRSQAVLECQGDITGRNGGKIDPIGAEQDAAAQSSAPGISSRIERTPAATSRE